MAALECHGRIVDIVRPSPSDIFHCVYRQPVVKLTLIRTVTAKEIKRDLHDVPDKTKHDLQSYAESKKILK